ncbi:MAG: 30S ribosomal protein S1 [Flavobacteriales bacterium]|nr:30S ribosomal protein S1 [Flavobacteriales bacterium]MDG2247012.1 30S ribosomal protein S1 [Flavobacteriales bacterium]
MAEENKSAADNAEEKANVEQGAEAQAQNEETKAEATESKEEVKAEATETAETKEEVVAEAEEAASKEQSVPAPVKPEDFDWDAFEGGDEEYSTHERERLEGVYGNTLNSIKEKEVVDGTVVSVGKKEVVINIGYKSEGVVQASEFRYNQELAAGDTVPVFIERQEDPNGQLIISHKTARMHSAWDNVNAAMDNAEIITGEVKCRTKGGLIVDVFGIEAFLPGSQIDVKPIRDYDQYVGKQMEFKVVKINQEFKNVVVSHKALIEAELEEQKKAIIGGLEKGQVLEGIVKNITSYGVFVDLGGVDGLVHITDLSWGRINHPEEVVELDQKINVVILDFDDNKKRIALGLKQLSAHPWDALDEKLAVGDKVKGKVVVLADYGAFVEIAPGVEGLVHVSEMSWSQHLRSAQDFLKVGSEIDATVLTLDREERKMSLGMKQLMPDPWEAIEEKYPVQSRHKATVRNFTNFGVFVELEEGIDGLIHISDLSWSKKIKHPSEFCNVGDELEVMVLELDKENRRLSLGHKQLEENPWDVFENVFEVGSVHQGTVIKKEGSQAVVALPYGVEGYCSTKQLKKADGATIEMEEAADFMVLEFNKNAKRITVSHTRTFEEGPAPTKKSEGGSKKKAGGSRGGNMSKAVDNVNSQSERTTLGDLSVLSQLKEKMNDGDEKPAAKPAAKKEPKADAAEGEAEGDAKE